MVAVATTAIDIEGSGIYKLPFEMELIIYDEQRFYCRSPVLLLTSMSS